MPDVDEREARLWETLGRIEETLKKLVGDGEAKQKEPEKVPAPPQPPAEDEQQKKDEGQKKADKPRSFLDWLW